MRSIPKPIQYFWWVLTVGLFAGGVVRVAYYTPDEVTMGVVQKIFYLHMPVAINTLLSAFVCFIASIGYMWTRKRVWDDLAVAAAKVVALFGCVVLITGILWAKPAWGAWWTWSPRLTFSLVLWLLYVVYLMLRPAIESYQRRATVSAIYGIVAFIDVPLVWLSARMIPDYIHPEKIEMEPAMKMTLLYWFAPVTLAAAGLIYTRFMLNRKESMQQIARQETQRNEIANMATGGAL